ncbi:MAG: hypothetical protein L6437_00045 [Kiritimatiellae bacterium]|nr:hypothetical protein [Kiritimatiellia bacterium]
MSLIDELEFCHCDLNTNLNELVRAVQGATGVRILGCGEVRPERKEKAVLYAKALEAWLNSEEPPSECANQHQTVTALLHGHDGRKDELVGHLIKRLRDNKYEFYDYANEDFETVDSRIQHLEICCFNWEHNLLILLDEIGKEQRTYGWHGVGLFCACGDKDPDNNYPLMLKGVLDSIEPKQDKELLSQLKHKLGQQENLLPPENTFFDSHVRQHETN